MRTVRVNLTRPGSVRWVLSWSSPVSCSHLSWYACASSGAGLGPRIGAGGDQRDQLSLAVTAAVGRLVLDHPRQRRLALIQVLPRARGLDQCCIKKSTLTVAPSHALSCPF